DQTYGHSYDARSEVYAFGCVLFEILAGSVPFKGETAEETISMHAQKPAPSLAEVAGTRFPRAVEALVARCLQKDREQRFQTMADAMEGLDKLIHSPSSESEDSSKEPVVRRKISRPRRWVFAVWCLVFIGGVGRVVWTISNQPKIEKKMHTKADLGPNMQPMMA